jgi:hypothetical protein
MDGHPLFDLNIYTYPIFEKMTAPGLMIFPPTGKVARGRENNLLIVYFTLSGQTAITTEGLHTWMEKKAESFHRNPGTVTAGMRELIESVNLDLYQRNTRPGRQNSQVELDLQVAVIKREMLYLANCGRGQCFFIGGGNSLHLRNIDQSSRGLGCSQAVGARFSQCIINSNDLLLLSFNTPENWTEELMAGGQQLSSENFARRLFNSPDSSGRGLIIRFQEGTGKVSYLRYTQAPVRPAVIETIQAGPEAVLPPAEEKSEIPFKNLGPDTVLRTTTPLPAEKPNSSLPSFSSVNQVGSGQSVKNQAARQPQQGYVPAVESKAAAPREPLIETDAIKSAVGKTLRTGAKVKRQASDWVKQALQKVAPGKPDQPVQFSRGLLIAIAVVVPVIIATIAILTFVNHANSTTPQYLALAQKLYQQAGNAGTDGATRLTDYQQSIYWLDKADSYGKSSDSIALRNTVQASIDTLQGVISVDMVNATSDVLLSGTNISQMSATNTDLYALDSSSGKVLRFSLNGGTYQEDKSFDCGPNPKNPISNLGPLVDMVSISPDNSYNATILAVDAKGTLDYCVPGDTGYIVKLSAPDMGWGKIQSISLYQSNLYVLDNKDNAVFRFEGSGIDFPDKPTLFFDEEIPPLADALDIEEIGYELYILRGNGQMVECTYSPLKDMKSTTCLAPAPFVDTRAGKNSTVNSFPDAQFVQMHLTESPDSSLYLLDASKDTIYHFSYLRNLQRVLHPRLTDGNDSTKLIPTSFTVSSSRILFLAFSNRIYYGQIP